MANVKASRKKIETLIYKVYDILDKTGKNTEYYKRLFAGMSDKEFVDFFKQDFPLKYQVLMFKNEPAMDQIIKGLDFIKVPVTEKVSFPFLYENSKGEAVTSELPVTVVYTTIKRMKQMVQKKTGYSVNIAKRDYRTGLLIDIDKNGNSTDREFESLVTFGLPATLHELSTYRADAMKAKSKFYNEINLTGIVRQADVPIESDDSIARNLISAYLIGCHINSNLVNIDNFLPRTIKKRKATQSGLTRDA